MIARIILMSKPLVSIIVPTYNRDRYLQGALSSLIGQETNDQFDFEVVVVDNGSTDDTRSVVAGIANEGLAPVHYVLETREGVANARNAGIRAANGDWYAFFDDDQLAISDWLFRLFDAAQTKGSKCVGGAVHLDLSEDELQQISLSCRETILRERSDFCDVEDALPYRGNQYPGTGNLLLARSVLDDVGIFDERLVLGGEDHDLAIRIRRAGYDMWYVPGAVIRHRVFPKRLTPEFMRWDAIQGGAESAFFDHRYRGAFVTTVLCGARIVKSATLTLPHLVIAKATRNSSADLDCQMRLRRQEGYIRCLLTLLLPSIFPEESLTQRWAFRKGREIELS
jgi:GT2 family glycosyltransferase